ncbi:MAG: apolipoprotein N-acyltransferase [Thioploca sp.]|nr:apolipoprotein N-acyltransferase [Thioploca sp.]
MVLTIPSWRTYRNDILSLLAGSSVFLAFAPFAWFPLAVLAPAILFTIWYHTASPYRAFARGLLFGMGMFGFGVSWVLVSFHQFGGIPLPGAIALTAAFVIIMALYIALLGGLLIRWVPKHHALLTFILILPATWTLIEWLRGWLFTGFPWLSLGYSQIDSPLRGFAPLLGVYGLSWLAVLTAGLLAYSFHSKKLDWRIGLIGIVIWSGGWLLSHYSWTQPTGNPIQVALLQGNIPQEFKWLSGYQLPSMERYLQLSQANRDADLIIWPETAIPLFYQDVSIYAPDFWKQLVLERQTYHTDFLIGVPVMAADNKTYFNSVMSVSDQPGFYYKHHLVPFGEYIPLQAWLGDLLKWLDVPLSEFSAGRLSQPPLRSSGQAIGVSICYEDAFGDLIRHSLPTSTLLVNVSNDAWFGSSIAPHQHLEIARMRALESGRYLLRTTNTGISAVIDAQGRIVEQTPQFEVITLRTAAQPYQGTTLYVHLGDNLIIISLFLMVVIGNVIQRFHPH